MLAVHDDRRRGRSKSPGGRERSTSADHRSLPIDTQVKPPSHRDSRRSSQKHHDSESDDDERRQSLRDLRADKSSQDPEYIERKPNTSSKKLRESGGENEERDKDVDRRQRKLESTKYHYPDRDYAAESPKMDRETSRRQDQDGSEPRSRSEKSKMSDSAYGSVGQVEHDPSGWPPSNPPLAQDYEEKRPRNLPPDYPDYAYAQPAQTIQPPAEPREAAGYRGSEAEERREPPAADTSSYLHSPPGSYPIVPHMTVPADQNSDPLMSSTGEAYMQPTQYQYAQVDQNVRYKPKQEKGYTASIHPQYPPPFPSYDQNAPSQYVELKRSSSKQEEERQRQRQRTDRHKDGDGNKSVTSRLDRLSVSTGALPAGIGMQDGSRSPILESYRGTYQSISPMPSPMMLAKDRRIDDGFSSDPSDLDLPPKRSSSSSKSKDKARKEQRKGNGVISDKRRPASVSTSVPDIIVAIPRTPKRVSFYDPIPDAQKISAALCSTDQPPDAEPLILILPSLTTDDMLALRTEYKNHAKTSGKGINMAKHIKLCVPGNLGKAAYATALGRWESEAYWANMWYQSGGSRRELLIESLMGRSNSDIREIKNCFRDKRYGDELEQCMMAELKADKFRTAIMLALSEDRMPDSATLDVELIKRDVRDLYRALTASAASESGSAGAGETAMIHIIVLRSDSHLRAVLRAFEDSYDLNFAREMISRSRNLVGETLAHILNGALNRPMRDALLLHQAMTETAPGRERAELLISRVVRLHWEARHRERVKKVYRERYRVGVGEALRSEVWKPAKKRSKEEAGWVEFLARCLDVDMHEERRRRREGDDYDRDRGHGNASKDRYDDQDGDGDRDRDRDRNRDSEKRHRRRRRRSDGSRTGDRRDSHGRESELELESDRNDQTRRRSGAGNKSSTRRERSVERR